jgi:hypothetical protein
MTTPFTGIAYYSGYSESCYFSRTQIKSLSGIIVNLSSCSILLSASLVALSLLAAPQSAPLCLYSTLSFLAMAIFQDKHVDSLEAIEANFLILSQRDPPS